MDNCLCAAKVSAKHTGLKVQPWDLQTTPQLNNRFGPTPSALSKMVESNNRMPNIKRRNISAKKKPPIDKAKELHNHPVHRTTPIRDAHNERERA